MSNINKLSKMKHRILFFSVVLIFFAGCTPKIPDSGEISLKWEMVSNEYAETPQAKAKFYLENKSSNFTLNDKNWALFFCQLPR